MNATPTPTYVEIEPRKINFDFSHFAVCIAEDFSMVDVIPAHIHPAETLTCVGIVPGTTRVAPYEDSRVVVTVNMHGFDALAKASFDYLLGVRPILADKPDLYETSIREARVGELFGVGANIVGFFKSKSDALREIEKKRSEYITTIKKKIDSALAIDEISRRFA